MAGVMLACIAPERTASSKFAFTSASYSADTTNGWSSTLSPPPPPPPPPPLEWESADADGGVADELLGGDAPYAGYSAPGGGPAWYSGCGRRPLSASVGADALPGPHPGAGAAAAATAAGT